MFKNVVVGIDGTAHGRDAIALAGQLSDSEAQLTFVHVHWRRLWSGGPVTAQFFEAETAYSWQLLQREQQASGVDAQLASVIATSPGRGLHLQAEQQRADVIVVGSCRRGLVGRAALGDDTRAAINGASCAVAVAPNGFAGKRPQLDRIGVAYNSTPESDAAFAAARSLATRHHAALSALDVVRPPAFAYGYTADLSEYARHELDAARRRVEGLADLAGRAVCGVPGEELARFSGEVDLLVVGSRGYGPLRRVIFGSTSNYLARHARSALLVLPRPAVGNEQSLGAAPAGA